MEQETLAAQTIETVGTDALYDESVKRLPVSYTHLTLPTICSV